MKIQFTQVEKSRIEEIDFSNLAFGKVFTDHMFMCDYANGAWNVPTVVPYQPLSLDPSTMALHYGQLMFEGLKAYVRSNGEIVLFRPDMHAKRWNRTAERLCMPTFPEEDFVAAIKEVITIDKAWIPNGQDTSMYIRPFMIATDIGLGVTPSKSYKFMILLAPSGKYYDKPVRVFVEPHYVRAAPGGLGYAKAAANYVASLYPTEEAIKKGYQQLIWTDAKEHKYIEESGTMNIMFMIGDTLVTPAAGDSVLSGVTRDSILALARDKGIKVEERAVTVDEIVKAHQDGSLKDIFGCGTAVTIGHIEAFHYDGKDYELSMDHPGRTFSKGVKEELRQIRLGEIEDKFNWVKVIGKR